MSIFLETNAAKNTLLEIASQAYGLAMGLQNAAPSQVGGPSKSVQYLLETALQINKINKTIEEIALTDSSPKKV